MKHAPTAYELLQPLPYASVMGQGWLGPWRSAMGVAGELTRGVLMAVGGLIGSAILVFLVSFIVSALL